MELNIALTTIKALADDVDPSTGEVLSKESCFNSPDTIRALFTAKETIERCIKENKRKNRPG